MGRTFFVGGNWKMNGSLAQISGLVDMLNKTDIPPNTEVVVAPPSIYADRVRSTLKKEIGVAGQNTYTKPNGAYTGELSPNMFKDVGIEWVILGHSERRELFRETDDIVGEKTKHALECGLKVIACVGEKLNEREQNITMDVVSRQLEAIAKYVSDWKDIVVAYEPVWAIGTGKVATPDQAQETHQAIRKWFADNVSPQVAESIRIIYGGSVSGSNANTLAKEQDIDGFLVGGASLKPEFANIIRARA